MRLSPHFTLRELTRSQLAARRGIENRPAVGEIENLKRLCTEILEPVRAAFGVPFSPSSGFRSPAVNQALGGATGSQHTRGEAVDFELPGIANQTLARWIRDNLEFDQLILEFPDAEDGSGGWVHCSLVADGNRRQVLTRTRAGYSPGLGGDDMCQIG
ncbi:MAG: DUF882 domain-containing protein [Alphaproteobacteria bacterium]|nr:MAG: DUF882 domain-containing protein [Alphaproteobacteria bacterium]